MTPGELAHLEIPADATHAFHCECGASVYFKIQGPIPVRVGRCPCGRSIDRNCLEAVKKSSEGPCPK